MINAIEVKKLEKVYDKKKVVDEIDFNIKEGEFVSILGPNGAGKTTLINMLSTILTPDGGSAMINGHSIKDSKNKIRKDIGITPQDLIFYQQLTAKENLVFFAQMHGFPKEVAKKNADIILEKLGLSDRKDKCKNFSGGMKRRLNFAINMVFDPKVIFLDEVTVGLDPEARLSVWDFIKKLKRNGKTIILTTHNMLEAQELSDRVLIMNEGKIIAEGSPQYLIEHHGGSHSLEIELSEDINLEGIKDKLMVIPLISDVLVQDRRHVTIFFSGGLKDFIFILKNPEFFNFSTIESLNLRQPNLEDVFLKLTGRRLVK